jgi:hypothetical protein
MLQGGLPDLGFQDVDELCRLLDLYLCFLDYFGGEEGTDAAFFVERKAFREPKLFRAGTADLFKFFLVLFRTLLGLLGLDWGSISSSESEM